MSDLETLAQQVLDMSAPPFDAGTQAHMPREVWERKVKAKLAEVFRLGMSVGWEKASRP